MTVTDVVPEPFVVDEAALEAESNPPDYTITYDEATRTVTVVYGRALTNPAGETGWPAGTVAPQIDIPVTVPADTTVPSGTVVTNTATNDARNAPADDASVDVTINVPRVVTPTVTKEWGDGSAVAGSGEASTITLNVKNQSSSSAQVSELTVSDTTPETFESFDFTGATVTAFPAGADTATLTVNLADGSTAEATVSAPAPATFALPPGTDTTQVVGYTVTFTNSNGDPLPYDATGGTVEVGMQLRDTARSTGQPLRPTDKVTVNNCASPSASDPVLGTVTGNEDCAPYDILPDTLVLGSTKSFFPDTNGNWQQDPGEHAVVGTDTPVTAKVDVTNRSPFPVSEITITEPDPDQPSEMMDKVDIEQVRLRFPAGATQAVLQVSCTDGSTPPAQTYTSDTQVDVASTCPSGVSSVTVTYTGVDADGNPTIQPDATAGLDLHGPLNDQVTDDDLPSGTSPGVSNCASFSGDAGRIDGSGTASGAVCQNLPVESPDYSGDGTKTASQTDVPPGQPVTFHIEVTNNGNVGLFYPVISDPEVDSLGRPVTDGNPFTYLQLTGVTVSVSPSWLPHRTQVYDPSVPAWVAYNASDTALMERATGVRVIINAVARR